MRPPDKEVAVAVAFIQEWQIEDRSTSNYDAIQERLDTREDPPDGGIFHTAGFDDDAGVFRIFDVWETREQGERFISERLQPILSELMADVPDGRPPDREAWYELHDLMP
jgi:hypothetical protein